MSASEFESPVASLFSIVASVSEFESSVSSNGSAGLNSSVRGAERLPVNLCTCEL